METEKGYCVWEMQNNDGDDKDRENSRKIRINIFK